MARVLLQTNKERPDPAVHLLEGLYVFVYFLVTCTVYVTARTREFLLYFYVSVE